MKAIAFVLALVLSALWVPTAFAGGGELPTEFAMQARAVPHPSCTSPFVVRTDWVAPAGVAVTEIEFWTLGSHGLRWGGKGSGSREFWQSRNSTCMGFAADIETQLMEITLRFDNGYVLSDRILIKPTIPCGVEPAGTRLLPAEGRIYLEDGLPAYGTVLIETCKWRDIVTVPVVEGQFLIPAVLRENGLYRVEYRALDGRYGYAWYWFADLPIRGVLQFTGFARSGY